MNKFKLSQHLEIVEILFESSKNSRSLVATQRRLRAKLTNRKVNSPYTTVNQKDEYVQAVVNKRHSTLFSRIRAIQNDNFSHCSIVSRSTTIWHSHKNLRKENICCVVSLLIGLCKWRKPIQNFIAKSSSQNRSWNIVISSGINVSMRIPVRCIISASFKRREPYNYC